VSGHYGTAFFQLVSYLGSHLGKPIRRSLYLGKEPIVPEVIEKRIKLTSRFANLDREGWQEALAEALERMRANKDERERNAK
jgi:hypothetical protein